MSDIENLKAAYFALLDIDGRSAWRANNQAIYATLRDAIAVESGQSSEDVQNECEAIGFDRRHW